MTKNTDSFDEILNTRAIVREPYAVNLPYSKLASTEDIVLWLEENCKGRYKALCMLQTYRVVFYNNQDLTLFKIRWL